MRKLVTLRKVSKLIPIEGKDVIELAEIDGWQCIVKIILDASLKKCIIGNVVVGLSF